MDYLISLLGLIENKKKITGGNFIDLSLEEIANAWNEKSVLAESFQTTAGAIKGVNKNL